MGDENNNDLFDVGEYDQELYEDDLYEHETENVFQDLVLEQQELYNEFCDEEDGYEEPFSEDCFD